MGSEDCQRRGEVGFGGLSGVGEWRRLEALFGEGTGVEGDLYGGRRGGGGDLGEEGNVLYKVEGEAGAVGSAVFFRDGVEVPGGDAGFEDQVLVGFGDAVPVVYDDEGTVAAGPQGRSDVDVAGAGIAGVA